MGRLGCGQDLIEAITAVCVSQDIRAGRILAIGAVQRARVGFYNQATRAYAFIDFEKPLEITALVGNVSIKDGSPMAHCHVTLMDEEGQAFGGHLAPGTIVFACELTIEEFSGAGFTRAPDDETGLPLWTQTP